MTSGGGPAPLRHPIGARAPKTMAHANALRIPVNDFLPSATLEDYSCLEVGISARGLQVWCKRHNRNVAHLDLDRLQATGRDESSVRRSSSGSAFQTHQLTRLDE